MKITKTIITTNVTMATVEVRDGKAETKTSTVELYSCEPLSSVKFNKAVRKIDPKAVVVATEQSSSKYSMDIEDFVKYADIEQ